VALTVSLPTVATCNFRIGNSRDQTNREFDGRIAHVGYHTALLTDGEMMQAYTQGVVFGRSLQVYAPLGWGSTEPDYSGNTHTGTVTGATAIDSSPIINPFRRYSHVSYVVSGGGAVTPNVVVLTFVVPEPTITLGEVIQSVNPCTVSFVVPEPTLAPGEAIQTPDAVIVNLDVPEPAVVVGEATVTPDSVVLTFDVPEPTLVLTGIQFPNPIVVNLAAPEPTLTMGEVIVLPDSVVVNFVVPNTVTDNGEVGIGRGLSILFRRRRRQHG
jgi:hypothetical protein